MQSENHQLQWLHAAKRYCLAVAVATMLPFRTDATVVVEPSVPLTIESIEIAPKAMAFYHYELGAGDELVFSVDLFRWRHDPLRVWLLDELNYRRFAVGRSFQQIHNGTGAVERAGQVRFEPQTSGRYFIVLDNSQSKASKQLSAYAYVRTALPSDSDDRVRRLYEGYLDEVMAFFDISDIEIRIQRCGQANAYARGSVVVFCRELDDELTATAMPGARLFVLLHEISHCLISRWGYRSINVNPTMIDRLAAMLFKMIDAELAHQTAAWYALRAQPAADSNSAYASRLPRARAHRIAEMLTDDELLNRGWLRRVVIPRLRTPALKSQLSDAVLSDRARTKIRRELSERGRHRNPTSASDPQSQHRGSAQSHL